MFSALGRSALLPNNINRSWMELADEVAKRPHKTNNSSDKFSCCCCCFIHDKVSREKVETVDDHDWSGKVL